MIKSHIAGKRSCIYIFAGTILLLCGYCLYLVYRQPGATVMQTWPVSQFLMNIFPYNSSRAQWMDWMPSLIYVLAFSLISIGMFRESARYRYAVPFFWMMVSTVFEAGQYFHVHIAEKVPAPWADGLLVRMLDNYFRFGTFDFLDLAAGLGGMLVVVFVSAPIQGEITAPVVQLMPVFRYLRISAGFALFSLGIVTILGQSRGGADSDPPASLRLVNADKPVITIAGKGTFNGKDMFIAAWEQANTATPNINPYTSHYAFGSRGWLFTQTVDKNSDGQITLLRVAGSADGSGFAVWYELTSQDNRIYVNRLGSLPFTNGSTWGTPQPLTDSVTVLDLAVAADTHGNAIVIWVQADSSFNRLYARRYNSSIGWETVQIIDDNTGNSELPRIAADQSGNAIAVWQNSSAASSTIYANYFSTSTGWGTAQLISSSTASAYSPDIAMNSAGTAMTVWHQDDGGTYNAYARRFVPAVGWETAGLIESGISNAHNVRVAIDDTGTTEAVWLQPDLYFNRHTPGNGWGVEQVIAPGLVDDSGIAANGDGKAIITWKQWNTSSPYPGDALIYARKFGPSTGWEDPRNLMSEQGSANRPNAAIDSKGNAVVIWSQSVASSPSGTTPVVFTVSY